MQHPELVVVELRWSHLCIFHHEKEATISDLEVGQGEVPQGTICPSPSCNDQKLKCYMVGVSNVHIHRLRQGGCGFYYRAISCWTV